MTSDAHTEGAAQGWDAAMEHVRSVLQDAYVSRHPSEHLLFHGGWQACCEHLALRLELMLETTEHTHGWGDREQQEAARDLLRHTMSRISEERWCAGWLVDLEYILWRDVLDAQRQSKDHLITYHDDARDLAFLAAVAGGWWRFSYEDKDEIFVPLDEWRSLYREREQKRQQHPPE